MFNFLKIVQLSFACLKSFITIKTFQRSYVCETKLRDILVLADNYLTLEDLDI